MPVFQTVSLHPGESVGTGKHKTLGRGLGGGGKRLIWYRDRTRPCTEMGDLEWEIWSTRSAKGRPGREDNNETKQAAVHARWFYYARVLDDLILKECGLGLGKCVSHIVLFWS